MSVARSQLIGKKIYNPDGELVGDIVDIGFALGESRILLYVKSKYGKQLEIPWENVAGAKDIVILKEAIEIPRPIATPSQPVTPAAGVSAQPVTPTPAVREEEKGFKLPFIGGKKEEARICPQCGKPATWIPQYKRWYCYNCQKYLD